MPPAPSTAELLRSIGLDVDGPVRWGTKPPSRAAGIFAIEATTPAPSAHIEIDEVRRWLERVPDLRMDGERPTQSTLATRLRSFWLPEQTLLYVGRTAKSMSARVASLYATELGHARPHPGGHWLKALKGHEKLRVWWAETEAPEEYEDALIGAVVESVPDEARASLPDGAPVLPWANLGSPTGSARDTGLTGYLLSVEATPTKDTSVKRSSGSTVRRRRASTTSATPRSPRKAATKPKAGGTSTTATAGKPKEQPTHNTAEGLAAMEAELVRLKTVERPEVVERVKNARELGDLRENADYEAARNEQSFLEGRIIEIEQRLRTAVVIKATTGDAISMGSTVGYEIDGASGELTIVGSAESDPSAGKVSAVSPVGKALVGHRQGDDVVVATPAAEIHYRIVEVK
jgi:transcription elongation factor GreA